MKWQQIGLITYLRDSDKWAWSISEMTGRGKPK